MTETYSAKRAKILFSLFEYMSAFLIGGVIYGALETIFRGYTHPSMLLTGGVCFAGLYATDKHCRARLLYRVLIGAAIITAAELCAGLICNVWLGLDVWDYSRFPLNFMGQICPLFSALWALLTLPAYMLSAMMRSALGVHGARSYSPLPDGSSPAGPSSSDSEVSAPPPDVP